jgi:putative acetyltransferase
VISHEADALRVTRLGQPDLHRRIFIAGSSQDVQGASGPFASGLHHDGNVIRPGVAVVTGATRGLGAALTADLMARGHRMAVCATDTPLVAGALCRAIDVADPDAVEGFATEVASELGAIDLWINNAAVIGPIGLVGELDPADWRRCLDVNVLGTVHGSRSFLRRRSPEGVLVNIASRAGVTAVAGLAAYSATKAAVIALTKSIAAEDLDRATAFVVVPPSVDTDMQRVLLAQDEQVFPGVVESRNRRDHGGILGAADAAALILRSVLDDRPTPTVIDLSHASSSTSSADDRLQIAVDDPLAADVRALLERHLAFSHEVTPVGHVHALDVHQLRDPTVTFFAARRGGLLVGVGAIRELDTRHGELKSMHTAESSRGQGVARAILEHLLDVARARRYTQMSLETGTMEAFAPARALYLGAGFEPCEPFGEHTRNPFSICMSRQL